jgi:V-type H+-transporting ATPase subunit a
MSYVSLIIQEDCARSTLSSLGSLSALSFTDLNPHLTPFQRRYVGYVKRCDELERRLRFFGSECSKFSLVVPETVDAGEWLSGAEGSGASSGASSGSNILAKLEEELEGYERQLKQLNAFNAQLTSEYNSKIELHEVLLKGREVYESDAQRVMEGEMLRAGSSGSVGGGGGGSGSGSGSGSAGTRGTESLLASEFGGDADNSMRFSSLTGVVSSEEKSRFERMIFRATRGNCYIRFSEITQAIVDPDSNLPVKKHVFIVFFKSDSIAAKIRKICDAFEANRYSLPDMNDSAAVNALLSDNANELADSHAVLTKNQDTRYRLCQLLASNIQRWTYTVVKEKSVYHTLNMMKSDVAGMLRGEGWIIASQFDSARDAVTQAHSAMDLAMPSLLERVPQPWPQPPTHFETNSFTYAYQEFVNTYGVPRYREANPALFTAATFPFLFGVMYGDIGHGTCLFLLGLYLMYTFDPKAKYDEMVGGLFTARYMVVMMGFFGVYAGFMYNDFFSLGLNIFKSRWFYEGEDSGKVEGGVIATQTADYGSSESIYPIGMDPAWHISSNELLFFNSFKMKLSVIMGILQMFMGTLLKGSNALYFGERLDLFFEVFPMIAFAGSLFLYMIVLIVMKWTINWNSRMLSATCLEFGGVEWGTNLYEGKWAEACDSDYCTPWGFDCGDGTGSFTTAQLCPLDYGGEGDGCQPPNLITTLINIALQPGTVAEPMYGGQPGMQNTLLLIAFVSVPVLLLAKPYLLSKQAAGHGHGHGDADERNSHNSDTPLGEGGGNGGHGGGGDDEEHGFGDLLIHQAIETIEFVLGMVSNTASYLRLWALSLAHSKLAGVFWEKAMLPTINMNFFAAFIGFGVFAACATSVLLMMDVLECFLVSSRRM